MRPLILLTSLVFAASAMAVNTHDALKNCRAISDNSARLQCYDAINTHAAEMPQKVIRETPALTSPPAEAPVADKSPDELFGFEDRVLASQIADSLNVDVIETALVHGKRVFRFANGQVWRQIDSKRFVYNPDNGQAYIQRGALGSFFFSQKETNVRIRVKRVE